MSRILTLEQLRQKGACADQARLFRAVFGERAEVTIESCVAVADVFDWNWAALHLLSAPARAGYYSAMEPHLTVYGHVDISPWAERQRFRAAKWAISYIGDQFSDGRTKVRAGDAVWSLAMYAQWGFKED